MMNLSSLYGPVRRSLHRRSWICTSCSKRYASNRKGSVRGALPNEPARTRFAPSPTGSLHLGSLRTALFNYLLAKSTGGQFLLRIEDTDQRRTVPGAKEKLCHDLRWAGLEWDEGPQTGGPYGPYRQSERTAIYQQHAEKLLKSQHAYRCFCSTERLLALAKQRADLGLPTDYDRACTHIPVEEAEDRASKGESHVIRLKVPVVYPEYNDIVYGLVRHRIEQRPLALSNPAYEDPILIKSDGFPTYHLANVVDDHLMKITHVVRGAEWMSSTPKHLAMYQAFGWQPPAFAHVGLLTDLNGQKLSKRNLDVDVASYRDKMGILPEALINFVALLGWSHGKKKDFMSMSDLIKNFSMKFTTGDTVVTFEKMWFLQKLHASAYIDLASTGNRTKLSFLSAAIASAIGDRALSKSMLAGRSTTEFIEQLLELGARGYTNAPEFVINHKFFFSAPETSDYKSAVPTTDNLAVHIRPTLFEVAEAFDAMDNISPECWNSETISEFISKIAHEKYAQTCAKLGDGDGRADHDEEQLMLKKQWSKLIHDYARWTLTAGMPGPPTVGAFVVLGRPESMDRLRAARMTLDAGDGYAELLLVTACLC